MPVHLRIGGRLSPARLERFEASGVSYSTVQRLTREELAEQYPTSDLVVFTSTNEGFGPPIVEAHASGRPVITSTVASMPELVGDAALLLDPHDAGQMAEAVERLVTGDDLYRDLVERGLSKWSAFEPGTPASALACTG